MTDRLRLSIAGGFVLAVWAVCLAVALAGVARWAYNVPMADSWEFVPQLVGASPITGNWLWELHNEHRIVLTKLVMALTTLIGDYDYRTLAWLNVSVMGAAALALMWERHRRRGGLRFSHAFIPVLFLHWGQAEVFLWDITSQFVYSAVLFTACVTMTLRPLAQWSARRALLWSAGLTALTLTGANGLAAALPLLAWSVAAAVVAWRRDASAGAATATVLALGTAVALVLAALSLYDVLRLPAEHANPGPAATAHTALAFLAAAFGSASGQFGAVAGAAMLLLTGVAFVVLGRRLREPEVPRLALSGVACGLAGMLLLALAIGWGRAYNMVGDEVPIRYATLALPLAYLLYLVCEDYARGSARLWAPMALLLAGGIACGYNAAVGEQVAPLRDGIAKRFEADVLRGLADDQLTARYANVIYPTPDVLGQRLAILRDSAWGPFAVTGEARYGRLVELNRGRFPMFATMPYSVESRVEVKPVHTHRGTVLMVHAPGEIRYRLAPGRHTLRASFGLLPGSYLEGKTNGVRFTAAVRAAGQQAEIWSRVLDPLRQESDRSGLTIEASFTTAVHADLVLITDPGAGGDTSWDWSYWTGVGVEDG